jgi:hypothetical protein
MEADTLYIDCTASAVEPRAMPPIFDGSKIVLQLVRAPLPTFSAALIAHVEAHYPDSPDLPDDALKNKLCGNVPFPHTLADYPRTIMANMMNQMHWGQDEALRTWIRESRLDGFGNLMARVDPNDAEKTAVLMGFRATAAAAMANIPRLLAAAG